MAWVHSTPVEEAHIPMFAGVRVQTSEMSAQSTLEMEALIAQLRFNVLVPNK